jgi:hypothetical protein
MPRVLQVLYIKGEAANNTGIMLAKGSCARVECPGKPLKGRPGRFPGLGHGVAYGVKKGRL